MIEKSNKANLAIFGGKPALDQFIPYGKQYIDDNDLAAVCNVLKQPYLTTGPKASAFEKKLCEYTGAKYAVVISNGTAALHAACNAAGIGECDEVIVSSITFAASANCVLYCGATPVFADIDPINWNVDPEDIRRKITKKTKAIIAVDFTGQCVKVDEIKAICKKHNLVFIQDAAHSIGTKYKGKYVGSLADLTTFSFHPVKTITSGEGGAILTNDENMYKKMVLFRTHSITRDTDLLSCEPHYKGYNEQINLGYNYRMTDFQAALGISQLLKIEYFSSRRKEIVKEYNKAFSKVNGLIIQEEIPESDTTRHIYIIRIDRTKITADRKTVFEALNAENIGLQVHYIPVYYHPYYQRLGYKKGLCPNAEALYEDIITIPLFPAMSDEEVSGVITGVTKVFDHYYERGI